MDRKVEYVDLNGLQFFADELRRYLNQNILNVPILTELKVRIENLEDRDFYKIIESYDIILKKDCQEVTDGKYE